MGRSHNLARKLHWQKHLSSIFMLFYYLSPLQNDWLVTLYNACSSLLGTRERFTCWARVPVTKKKGGERGKQASALGSNMETQTLRNTNLCDRQVQKDRDKRLITLHLSFVYGQNEIKFACPYFILGLMLPRPSHLNCHIYPNTWSVIRTHM